ncbi:cysteine desulfurase NifS [Candidatus Woesearchaeota archaeon]|nr:cysteine desulfurase NifS [Candidatus Woesearchaeota archaeon]MBW3022395.1 cysteine desulfurase NifS [Candidatus Woesearchaeota archaeon]
MKVYLDNGATTKVEPEVVKVMQPFFTERYGNASSLHQFGTEARDAVERSRKIIAESINAEPEEIFFTSGGTESDNLAIKGIMEHCIAGKGKHMITSKIEHPAVLNTCKCLEKQGIEVTYLDVAKNGIINVEQLKKSIKKNTVLVSIMHANNEIGTIQPIKEIAKICKSKKVLFHTDAVQSYTKEKIDVKDMGIDLASFSGHKIHGPKGIGFLYKRKGVHICPLINGGGHESGIRPGTENVPCIVGLAKAIEVSKTSELNKMKKLRDKLIAGLKEIPESILNGHPEKRLANNVNFCFKAIEGESLVLHLDQKGIAASTGSACSSHKLEPSHVLTAIGLPAEVAHGSLRLTLSKYTTEKEIVYAIKTIKEIVKNLRALSPLWGG